MEIELEEIRDHISQFYPFSTLAEAALNDLVSHTRIRYLRRDNMLDSLESPMRAVYLIRQGALQQYDEHDKLCQQFEEGDFVTEYCDFMTLGPGHPIVSMEDTLLFEFPCDLIKTLSTRHEALGQFFTNSIQKRMQLAIKRLNHEVDYDTAGMATSIRSLLQKPPVLLSGTVSLQEAAHTMSEHQVSCVMLTDAQEHLAGLITDRDLRKRCVAQGLDITSPASCIMSRDLHCIGPDSPLISAILLMTQHGIGHLPVVENNTVAGMLTVTDIIKHRNQNPAFIASEIRKADSEHALAHAAHRIPRLQLALANSGIHARHLGETLSSITDAMTCRLLELAIQKLGPPPVPFTWVVGGSQARMEQTAHSDQDNALILSDKASDDDRVYFKQLAIYVCDGLNLCGYVYCPGNAMATNDKWRQPLATWQQYFRQWIQKPEPDALLFANIFFDLRAVYGDPSLLQQLQQQILAIAPHSRMFLSHMAANALTHKPPMGFFRQLVLINDGKHDNTFDIKLRGLAPIIDIARVMALAQGVSETNTTERLRHKNIRASLGKAMSRNLIDALEFLATIRIQHQARQIHQGVAPDNFLPPQEMSALEKNHLKDAFAIIDDMQQAMKIQFHTNQLG